MDNSLPTHLLDEDKEVGGNSLLEVTQIMAEFFDNLYLKLLSCPSIFFLSYLILPAIKAILSSKKHILDFILIKLSRGIKSIFSMQKSMRA